MKDVQIHLERIRTDAAECILLSSLATDGKRELFARLAEHLNALAMEVEKAIRAGSLNVADATDHKRAAGSRRMFQWLLIIAFVAATTLASIAGFVWANTRAEKHRSHVDNIQSKSEPSHKPQDDANQAPAAPLQALKNWQSAEQEGQRLLSEQMVALAARVDHLERARAEVPLSQNVAGDAKPRPSPRQRAAAYNRNRQPLDLMKFRR